MSMLIDQLAEVSVPLPRDFLRAANRAEMRAKFHEHGYVSEDITDIDMLTVWLSLTNASKEMGCLQVVPGSHRGDLALHCSSSDPRKVGIPELMLGNLRHPVEMRAGDVHFHHRLLQHNSLPNLSDQLRFSFDLRYQPTPQATGQSAGMPGGVGVPGFVARSRANPANEIRNWEEWAAYQEAMRQQFMAIDWDETPAQNAFSSEHRYCI